jgi:phosphatidylglycerophosphatase A
VAEGRAGTAVWVATCAGIGYFPVAPGTLGSALGLGFVAALGRLPLSRGWVTSLLFGTALLIFFLGVWTATHAEKFFGRTDPGEVVIDEVVGQMVTFLARPDAPWKWLVAGFLLFRVFDIIKPFPARRAEKAPGGWGIMLDDVLAGAYSLAAIWLLGFEFK